MLNALAVVLGKRRRSRDELIAYQTARMRRLVSHAYRAVPYYRELFDSAGFRPEEAHHLTDLEKIPVSSRDDIARRSVEQILATGFDPDRLIVRFTTGSSGVPL